MRVLMALFVGLLLACGGESMSPEPLVEPPVDLIEGPSTEPVDPCAEVPEGDLRGNADAGKEIYQLVCAVCHGAEGRGDGPGAPPNITPADHTDSERMGGISDRELYCVIAKGGIAVGKAVQMPGWGLSYNEGQMKDIVAYLRSLSGT